MKIKTGDNVLIIAGKDKGKKGKVMRVMKKTNSIVVEKVNIKVRHIKKTATRKGEKIQFEAPIDASNAKVICPECKKAVRIGYVISKDQKKRRVCKKCKEVVDQSVESKSKKKK
ncbi:MAG: 50S ribosomal protein L24 [uncultured bacterium]|nr:MAG: 50S ribosomal protein L24 [uncultured bacterium]OGJ47973.1 MAG: 50S ribosomal protein L24 [Candidatus Peregrinibacteria bacterium RIFOXYB12_FULL_41_12]OGJ48483.1 MAG: 50S ribosomal protein L24 [Candidatus Peregrinibacteria bacterium RIFOXYA2_FULL_41_18]OGJ52512.1 MAG: 50S ribosomal protein L24 [Candidatus Peregrinibacteria bacterium RIFOXYC2_FULL_41_22]OGJ55373.1 MAG: 50S ribosomal protein L24 [Candidatus Peregrinibacteria bacterium RIFOXYB2_FULL_41_88]